MATAAYGVPIKEEPQNKLLNEIQEVVASLIKATGRHQTEDVAVLSWVRIRLPPKYPDRGQEP
jgi:hypothetical protein